MKLAGANATAIVPQTASSGSKELGEFLKKNRLDKGSIDTYVKCSPFLRLAMKKTYTRENIMEGWIKSNIRDPVRIKLDRCPAVMRMSVAQRGELVEKVVKLAVDDLANGMCTDEDLSFRYEASCTSLHHNC